MRRKNRAQSMMEYAVLIAVVSAALVAMQIYIKRGMQGRLKGLANQISPIQYERGNTESDYTITRQAVIVEAADRGTFTRYMGAQPVGDTRSDVGTGETTTRTGWEQTVGSN